MRCHKAKTLESLQTLRSAYWAALTAAPAGVQEPQTLTDSDSGGLAHALAEENDTSATETVAIRVMLWSKIWLHLPHVLRIWEMLNLKITVCSGRTFKAEWCILAAAEEHSSASSGSTQEADPSMVQWGPGNTLSWHQNLTASYHPPHGTGVQSLKTPRLRALWKATEAKGAYGEAKK